ncbi:hypothetical protein [Hyphomonas sp.]|uniref:hypothetical protein n=1 Tax=Hyphomonas sp. TaxID=87 RepID=UPI00391CBB4D
MEERPASRTVTAYARGLYLAQIFQLAVAAIAILAVAIGGYMVVKQRNELRAIAAEREKEEIRLVEITAEQEIKLQLNETLTAAMVAMSEARPDDAFGSELAYSRALNELETALALLPEEPAEAASDAWKNTRQTIGRMMVGTLTSAQRLPQAIEVQKALLARETPGTEIWAGYAIGLAALHCQSGDTASAAAILTAELQAGFPDLLNDNAFVTACGAIAPPPPAPEMPDRSGGDKSVGFDDLLETPAPSGAITRVFLHIRTENQRRAAANIAARLCENRSLSVPGIELVAAPRGYPPNARAIYYYPDQAADAAAIAAIVQAEIAGLGIGSWNQPLEARLYQAENLPRDRVEIWLPDIGGDAASLGPGQHSCRARLTPAQEISQYVRELNDPESANRLNAGQQVTNALRSDAAASTIDTLLAELEGERLQALSATGRFNVLYMLNTVPDWASRPQADRLTAALATIEGRSATVAIGGQTRDCIDKLKTKLSGGAAPDTCGGR